MGTIMRRAQRSGCNKTRKQGRPIMPRNGINPSEVFPKKFLYLVQNAAAERIIESFKNSVGWSEKGIPGISNHPRAPFIFTQKMRTNKRSAITITLITLTCFFHHRYGILIAITIAQRPIPAWSIFLRIKRQLFGSAMLPVSTSLFVIRYESYTLTELIITDQKRTRNNTRKRRG